MAFPEALKLAVKKKAHFCCCLCHGLGVDVHHIVPQADGGTDDEGNAAPLCPSCHEIYGANPQKRKFIREAREFWYEICAQRYTTDPTRLDELSQLLKGAATKADLDIAVSKLTALIQSSTSDNSRSVQSRAREVAQLGTMIAPGVGVNRHCKNCGTMIGLYVGDQGRCPTCGAPW